MFEQERQLMRVRLSLLIALCLLAAGMLAPGNAVPPSPVRVFVSIPPQRYVADGVGGDLVETHVLVGPGQSPHTFEPTPRQMVALAASDVYLTVGLPFEERILEKLAGLNPDLTVVDTSRGVPRRLMEGPGETRGDPHDHESSDVEVNEGSGVEGRGTHGGLPDPHTWMNPRNVKTQAANACSALVRLRPDAAQELAANLAILHAELDELDAELAAALAPVAGEGVFVFHAAFGYFTDAYGLEQVAVESGGNEPGARALAGLIDRARRDGVRVIFVQPQFAAKSAEALAREIGGAVVAIDPLSPKYIENMRDTAREVAAALGGN